MRNRKIKKMILCAIFVALCSILSQIILPIGVVPVNLALIGVFVLSCTLDTKSALATVLIYIALGIVGIPVFAGFQSGFGVILGPTGGFIIGYIFTALIVSILINFIHPIPAMLVGLVSCYTVGCVWFSLVTDTSLLTAIYTSILPFVIFDIIKIVISNLIVAKIKKLRAF